MGQRKLALIGGNQRPEVRTVSAGAEGKWWRKSKVMMERGEGGGGNKGRKREVKR